MRDLYRVVYSDEFLDLLEADGVDLTSFKDLEELARKGVCTLAIEQAEGDVTKAAGLLGMARTTLSMRCKDWGYFPERRKPKRNPGYPHNPGPGEDE